MGQNRFALMRRMIIAIFCFAAYFWSENPGEMIAPGIKIGEFPAENIPNSGLLFFILGITILILSVLLLFILHLKTTITATSIILDGFWTARKVKIDMGGIVSVKQIRYKSLYFNQPVYNLHVRGKIRFHTGGRDAVELTDRDGLKYTIGSQKAKDLSAVLREIIEKKG